ncbi:general substrate transporter [Vararia minispora EC-137]|uniref:General substrate transporter n=1 Tax=Vararia minispora EC-137 TaxID=1314806 RepID=A0ACB8QTX4_9AGAM|nr:general substrate transporter [Vararia minispora EC-137]
MTSEWPQKHTLHATPSLSQEDSHSRANINVCTIDILPLQHAERDVSFLLRAYTICSIFASLSSFCFGFDTGSIGPIISMDQFTRDFNGTTEPMIQGLVVSSILITASLASAAAGLLSDRISRTRTFALGGAVFCAGSILSAAATSLSMLFAGRAVAGVGEGLFMSTVTVYVLEIAPTSVRGRLSCTAQLFATLGIASGYFTAYGTVHIPSSLAWRLLFTLQSVVAGLFAAGALLLPHSPRWLAHVGRTADADRAWERLGYTAAEVEKELEVQQREEREEAAAAAEQRGGSTLRMLFAHDVRRRTLLGVFLMAMQQACGIDGVLYYAPVLFRQAGLSSTTAAFLASGVSGLLNIACTVITQIFTDKWGRRPSMIRGGSVIATCMLLIGTLYASGATARPVGRWAVIALIYIFIVAFAMSWAVVNRIYCSEIQPMHTRAAATSLGQCANWVVNWVIAFSTPLFLARSSSGPYFLFGACALLTVAVCALFQPESRGVSLEALDGVFEVSPWRKMLKGAQRRLVA